MVNKPDFGSDRWLRNLTDVCQSLGKPAFEDELYRLLHEILNIDHFVVFTYSPKDGPGHLFTRSKMPEEEAKALADDYINKFYERDPQLPSVKNVADADVVQPMHPTLNSDYDKEYQNHFFTQHHLIDKVSTVAQVEEDNVYCNFYRMSGSKPYDKDEQVLLESVLPIITSLISSHYKLLRFIVDEPEGTETHIARTMVRSVISRRIEPFDKITARESEICERILIGYTSTGIGLDLGIAPSSVNTYRRRAYEKLGIATQNELFSLCLSALNKMRR